MLTTRASVGFISTGTGLLQNREVLDEIFEGGFPLVQLTMLFAKPLKRLWRILPRTGDWATDIIAASQLFCGHSNRSYPENVRRVVVSSD